MDTASPSSQQPATSSQKPEGLSWRNWLNLVAYIVNVAVTYGSLTGIFGETNSDLSKKYQTLITPAGWAFIIWGPIFIWEGIFAVAQMFPGLRESYVTTSVTPYWVLACLCQVCWTIAFAQEFILAALLFMLGILGSLAGAAWVADARDITVKDYWLLRAPFSLHLGWIICASAVNINVLADFYEAEPASLLALAVVSLAAITVAVALYATAVQKPDCIPSLVAAWALLALNAELQPAKNLQDPNRFNPYTWDDVPLQGVRGAALVLSICSLVFFLLAIYLRWAATRGKQQQLVAMPAVPAE